MAIDNNKLEMLKTKQPQSVQANTTGAGEVTTSQISKPINMKTETKSDPITEAIKTPEFQNLSQEEQLEALKKQFPNIEEKELLKTLHAVKSVIEQEATEEESIDTIEPESENENEKIINDVAKDLEVSGKKNPTIDDVIAYVKSIPEDKRTAEQQKMLHYINMLDSKDVKTYTPQEIKQLLIKNAEKLDNLIPKNILESEEWQKKSPITKLNARADVILTSMIDGYENLSAEEKKQYRNDFYNKVGRAFDPKGEWDNLDADQKTERIALTAILIDATEFSGKSIQDILKADDATKAQMFKDISQNYFENKILAKFVDNEAIDVNSQQWKDLSGKEQINYIADSILTDMYPNYDPKSKKYQDIRDKYINHIAQRLYPDWNELEGSDKELREALFARELSAMKHAGISPNEFFRMDVRNRYKKVAEYEAYNNIELSAKEQATRETVLYLNKTEITDNDVMNYLKSKKNLTEKENAVLKDLEVQVEVYGEGTLSNKSKLGISYGQIIKNKFKGKYNEFIESYCKKHNITLDELKNNKDNRLKELIRGTNDEPEVGQKICQNIGVRYEDYADVRCGITLGVKGFRNGSTRDVNSANRIFHKHNTHEYVDKTTKAFPKYIKEADKRLEYAETTVALDARYAPAVAESWNNREYVTQEESIALGRDLNMSENVSNAAKSEFTKAFIETAAQNGVEEQLYFGKELSKIDNAAVTEGLAAASNSVDEQYRSQYNSYVETAMQNYPPEQQANIRSAMKTGEISQETLSQTTPPSGNNAEKTSSSSNTDSVQSSNTNSTTGNINQNAGNIQEVAATSGRTSASNATASAYTNIAAQTQNFTSQLKQQTVTEPTYYYQNKVEESIQGQTTNVSEEDLQYIDNIVQNNTNLSDSEEEKIRQIFAKAGTDVNVIYSIIINKYGSQAQDKFLEVLASNGSSDNIRSFVNSMKNDPSVIKKLYAYCSNQKLRSELLNMLPISDIISMISAGQIKISDLGTNNYKRVIAELKLSDPEKLNELFGEFESDINNKIASGYSLNNSDRQQLRDYLVNNIDSLSNTRFARYLQYLPIDTREELVALKNSPNKTAQSDEPQVQDQNASRYSADAATENKTVASEPSSAVQNSNSNKIKENGNKQDNTIAQQKTQPIFENHEMTKVLNDGTKVKRKESFGAVSDNTDMYEGYEEISQVSENPSMADPVLTPGSYEWQVKYNRQMAYQPPVTQPTNMPLEDDGILLGSNKVSPRLQIDKMKRRGPFYFNA